MFYKKKLLCVWWPRRLYAYKKIIGVLAHQMAEHHRLSGMTEWQMPTVSFIFRFPLPAVMLARVVQGAAPTVVRKESLILGDGWGILAAHATRLIVVQQPQTVAKIVSALTSLTSAEQAEDNNNFTQQQIQKQIHNNNNNKTHWLIQTHNTQRKCSRSGMWSLCWLWSISQWQTLLFTSSLQIQNRKVTRIIEPCFMLTELNPFWLTTIRML